MICSQCGFENNDTAKFCNECGASLVQVDDTGIDEQVDESTEQNSQDQDPSSTAVLDIPDIFHGEEDVSSSHIYDGFDFSPIDSDEGADTQDQDADELELEESLVDPGYEPPQKSWKSGDTMEMPRLEEDEGPKQTEFRAPAETKKRGKGRLIAIIVTIIVVLGALGAAAVTYQMEMWGGKSVPDVVGLAEDEASGILQDQGFVVKTMEVKSDDTEDKVLLMDPGSGRRLAEGSEVVLHVATPRVIPAIQGVSLENLKEELTAEGFTNVEYIKVKSNEPEDTVLGIDPVPGTKAQASAAIKVSVAEPYVIPDVVGKDAQTAVEILQNEGFVVESYTVYSEAAENTVTVSDPAPGTKVASGSTVILSVAKSLSAELLATTEWFLAGTTSLSFDGTNYEIVSYGGASYVGDHTTQAQVTVVGVTTLGDGETVRGSAKQRTITFTWSEPYTYPTSYY